MIDWLIEYGLTSMKAELNQSITSIEQILDMWIINVIQKLDALYPRLHGYKMCLILKTIITKFAYLVLLFILLRPCWLAE